MAARKGTLGARGKAFRGKILGSFALNGAETELLDQACRMLDQIHDLDAAVERDGLTTLGSTGQVRIHPAVAEARQHRLAVGRLLTQLALPQEDGATASPAVSARAKAAAQSRWSRDAGHQSALADQYRGKGAS